MRQKKAKALRREAHHLLIEFSKSNPEQFEAMHRPIVYVNKNRVIIYKVNPNHVHRMIRAKIRRERVAKLMGRKTVTA